MEIPRAAYDSPEDYLWVGEKHFSEETVLGRRRLSELRNGAKPNTPTEELLVANPVWLGFFLDAVIGNYPTLIHPLGPLPRWRRWFVLAECGPDYSDAELAQLIDESLDEER